MLCNRNPNPLFAKFVCYNNLLKARPICLIDVGAWGGPQPLWQPLLGCVKFIGFDFNEQECNRLNAGYRQQNLDITFYPYAIYDSATKKKFYVTKFPPSSGFIPGNENFLGRFLSIVPSNLEIVKEFETETINIDSFVKKEHIDYVDFIKVDVEGVEFSVLKGAQKCLSGMLGVETELNILSFPRSAWECRLDAPRRVEAWDAERPGPTFPRGAWERENERNVKFGRSEAVMSALPSRSSRSHAPRGNAA
jgi:FkbM family methyltransferase